MRNLNKLYCSAINYKTSSCDYSMVIGFQAEYVYNNALKNV